ncbi:MAG: hypothetical protein GY814_07485 [Gammaproteobacteria bacterium]|nr:hypothetical protein [Gammaproteobacteria bacterium]
MFDKIYQLAVENDVRMTCYVDDLTFSGDAVNSAFMFEVKKIIHHRGLKYHKECTFNATDPKLVTGVIVKQEQILVPNKLQLAISHGIENISSASPDEIRSLAGKCNAAAQIEPRFLSLARYVRKFLT